MSLPIDIICDIVYLAELPIDTRLALKMKPRKLVSPFEADAELMRTHDVMNYDACRKKGYYTKPYPDCFRRDCYCSHHELCDFDHRSWLCHAEYHEMYHNDAWPQ